MSGATRHIEWKRESCFRVPPPINALLNRRFIYSKMLTQHRQRAGDPPNGIDFNIALVLSLIFVGIPLAIFGAITSIVVNALYRVAGCWAITHVGNEVGKRMPPAFTNFYSTTSVTGKPFPVFIFTSGYQAAPDSIKRMLVSSLRVPVRGASLANAFNVQAAAGFGVAGLKPVGRHLNYVSTIANTLHFSDFYSLWRNVRRRISNHFKACILVSEDAYFGRHDIGSFSVMLSGGGSASTVHRCAQFA